MRRVRRRFGRAVGVLALAGGACTGAEAPAPPAWRDTLRVAVPMDVTTLDPHAVDRLDHFGLLGNAYETLVVNDAELRPRPGLAVRWENPDATTWVFHLRPARFASGAPLTARDVVFTVERLRRQAELQVRGYVGDVVAAEARQENVVVLRTARASPAFLSRLTNVPIVREGSTDETLRQRTDGSGPYAIGAWVPGRTLSLRRRQDAAASLPRQVEIDLGRQAEDAARGLAEGRYDLVRADLRGLEQRLPPGTFSVRRTANLFTKMLAFDHRRERTPFARAERNPFRDLRVRRAIHLALDRDALVARLSRQARPNVQPVPQSIFGFNPGLRTPAADLPAARSLLSDAGFPQGFSATLHTRAIHEADARLVARALAGIGIALDVAVPPEAEYFALLARGGASIWLDRFGCTTGDASEVLVDLMHTPQPERGLGTLNFGGFSDPGVDALAERVAAGGGGSRRRELLQQGMALLVERLPVVSLFNDEDVYGMVSTLSMRPRADSYLLIAHLGLE
jgi:peptide/nickel transport system substrate-binding protein